MPVPVEIAFKNLEHSDAVEAAIRKRCARLDRFAGDLIRCKVTVAAPHKHHAHGNTYHVSVDLHMPGAEVVVNRDPGKDHAHEDVYVAIRDAVDAAVRRIEDHARVRRGKVKRHEAPAHGRVAELHPGAHFGRITTPDGRLVYFHANSLVNGRFEENGAIRPRLAEFEEKYMNMATASA